MSDPRDDLPPSVYWRRRTLAVVGTSVAVLLFIWAVGALIGGNSSRQTNNAADEGTVPIATTTSAAPSSNPPPISAGARASSSTSASATTSAVPATTPAPSAPSSAPPPPPAPPKPCLDTAIVLTATTDRPTYTVGQRPVFTLHVHNIGEVACTRDVSRPLRDLVVVPAGSTVPLWSDTDCYAVPSHDIPLLQPGQEVTFALTWAGRTSAAGCPAHRTTVPAGQYALIAKLGPLNSAPVPFAITR